MCDRLIVESTWSNGNCCYCAHSPSQRWGFFIINCQSFNDPLARAFIMNPFGKSPNSPENPIETLKSWQFVRIFKLKKKSGFAHVVRFRKNFPRFLCKYFFKFYPMRLFIFKFIQRNRFWQDVFVRETTKIKVGTYALRIIGSGQEGEAHQTIPSICMGILSKLLLGPGFLTGCGLRSLKRTLFATQSLSIHICRW